MLENLTDKFSGLFSKLGYNKKLTESNIEDAIREIRIALIESEVNLKVIKSFIAKVKERSLGTEIVKTVTSTDMFIKVVHDTLVDVLGKDKESDLILKEPTRVSHVLVSGLQGAGKTTTLAKLAKRYKEKRDILTVSLDIHRPAAAEQLKILSEQVGVSYYDRGGERDIKQIVKAAREYADEHVKNMILFDSAGRTQVDAEMLEELKLMYGYIEPDENILVCDSMLGQKALDIAEEFKKTLPLDSLIFTKFDSDTRGGAILSVQDVVGVPIRYIGIGEKVDDLDEFDPARIADRILGMGDIVGLVNKAQAAMVEEDVEDLTAKLKRGEFDLSDFLTQLQQMKKMGSMESILSMIPGMAGKLKGMNFDDKNFKNIECIIQSMTLEERKKHFLINNSRKMRIAKGSGNDVFAVNQVLKKFTDMKKMMKKMSSEKKMKKMMSKMGLGDPSQFDFKGMGQ